MSGRLEGIIKAFRSNDSGKKPLGKTIWKILKRTIFIIFLLFVLLILFIRSPWGQDIIVSKATTYISNKTNTKVEIKKLYLTFSGNLILEGLYLEDKKGDTLVYSKSLEASVALFPLIKGKEFNLKSLEWDGLKATIYRKDTISKFNYDFLIDAFTTNDTVVASTSSESLKISLGRINFKDVDIIYNDEVTGFESALVFDEFNLESNEVDLDSMLFDINDITLNGAIVNYKQNKPLLANEEETGSKLPFLKVNSFKINNSIIVYESTPDFTSANLTIDAFVFKAPNIDLEKQIVEVDAIGLSNSNITFKQIKPFVEQSQDSLAIFEFPEWSIIANNVDLSNNEINLKTSENISQLNVFNPEDIQLKNVNFKTNKMSYDSKKASALVSEISFIDRSGFHLKNLRTQLELSDTSFGLKNLLVETNNNLLDGELILNYNSLDSFIKEPENTSTSINLSKLSTNPKDAFYFSPELKNNEYIRVLSEKQLTGNLQLTGGLNDLNIQKTTLNWGTKTTLFVNGRIKNLSDFENAILDITELNFDSNKKDALAFVKLDVNEIELPKTIKVKGTIKGGLKNFKTNIKLITPEGRVAVNGNFTNKNGLTFDGQLDVENLELDKLLKDDQLGVYSFTTQVKGSGTSLNTLNGTLVTDFRKLEFNSYDFSNLKLDGKITNGQGNIALNFKDSNLDFDLVTAIELDSVASKYQLNLDVRGADLFGLGLTEDDIRTSFTFEANIEGNDPSNLALQGNFKDAIAIKNKKPYVLGDADFEGSLTSTNTAFSINSNPINASLTSNTDVAGLISSLQEQIYGYLEESTDTVDNTYISNTTMELNATIKQAPILKDLFLPELTSLEPIEATVNFNEGTHSLMSKISAPYIDYGGTIVEVFNLELTAEKETLDFNFNLGSVNSNELALQEIAVKGNIKDQVLYTDFEAKDNQELLIRIATEITKKEDTIIFHINPSELVLNKLNWDIPTGNEVRYAPQSIEFDDFVFKQNEQSIEITNKLPEISKEHIAFDFKNFQLSTFTNLLNQEKLIASGNLNGNFIIEEPFEDIGAVANATITNLNVMEVPLGTLTLNAKPIDLTKYDLDLAVNGDNLNLVVEGDYSSNENSPLLNFDIDLKNLELLAVEEFTSSYISNSSGNLSGKIKITGTSQTPQVLGAVHFNDAGLTLNALNSSFSLPNESIQLDSKGLYFDSFTMLDINKNPFIIDGKINTEKLLNPSFDLTLNAKNIEVLNSTKEDNKLFYGKVNLNTNVSITGNLDLPKVRGDLLINDSSDFTYIIPEDEVDLIEREGVVIFVNKNDPDDILTKQRDDVSSNTVLVGYDIDAGLRVSKNAAFRIIIDERSGDNLKVSGTADLIMGISPNGDMSLSGKYEITKGHYEVSLYNLVKRRFDIASGSNIVWRGNPLEADMNIRAIYEIETAASGLMASQLTGENSAVAGKYRQKIPFLVYLNLNGELLKPEISFNLDIPKDNQGEFGGQVYSRVLQLNTQEEELNKQVFSLLVLNQFFPSSSTDGSSGGSLSIARDNANNVLSNQLNNFSDKLFGKSGVEVDFALDSYTDYQGDAPSNKTQLDINASKRLLNDKLIIEAGTGIDIEEDSQSAGQTTPLVGTVNIQYLFDDDGNWRIKAYRKNDFENVIDGQVILAGIALIFNQEFNKFEELFAKAVKEEVEKNNTEKATKKGKSKE